MGKIRDFFMVDEEIYKKTQPETKKSTASESINGVGIFIMIFGIFAALIIAIPKNTDDAFVWPIFLYIAISSILFWLFMWLWSKAVQVNEAIDLKMQIMLEIMLKQETQKEISQTNPPQPAPVIEQPQSKSDSGLLF